MFLDFSILILQALSSLSHYVHIIKLFLTTASCGISQYRGKRSYKVERSFGATGLPEFSTSTQKEEKADNATFTRGG
jgi:hypothetical protein